MRRRLIDAAIAVLNKVGYTAASTVEVQRVAGVSRGALLHHFPTKVDLMLATALDIVARQTEWYVEELGKLNDDRERFIEIVAITWEALKKPSGLALLEILMGTRSDPELHRRFPPIAKEIERIHLGGMWTLAKKAGIVDREAVIASTNLSIAAMRGLSIQLQLAQEPQQIERSAALLVEWNRSWMNDLCAAAGAPLTSPPHPVARSAKVLQI